MPALLFEIAKVIIVCGGLALIVSVLPLNETFKKIGLIVLILVGAVWFLDILRRVIH